MSECQLLLTRIEQKSKAPRFFWIFQPKECVYHEPFDLYLTFKNNSDQRFEGGTCKFVIRGELTWDHTIELPVIEPHQTKTITKPNIVVQDTGFICLTHLSVYTKDEKSISCKTVDGEPAAIIYFPLLFANREELYQKYAVVVAIFFSVLAFILTIVNMIVAIFK